MTSSLPTFTDAQILQARSAKNAVDPLRPYAFLLEPEYQPTGCVESVATLFLTNRECPFRCLFCDLWKNTTDDRVPIGAIPAQIDFALKALRTQNKTSVTRGFTRQSTQARHVLLGGLRLRPTWIASVGTTVGLSSSDARQTNFDKALEPARHIKLYNSGNFFDRQAIPLEDHAAIAERVCDFDTVIVENHPSLCGDACVAFRDRIGTQLEVAMGLETAHPEILRRLNKRMTVGDFARASEMLGAQGIRVRAFILVRAPFMTEAEGVQWAIRSMEFAFECGVECCSLIPTRGGNGAMESLAASDHFAPPTLDALEDVFDAGLAMGRGRVFVDLWDIAKLADCVCCGSQRIQRLQTMNLRQQCPPRVVCDCRH